MEPDTEYKAYLSRIASRFQANVKGSHVFTTDADNLWDIFVEALPADQRAVHNCHNCRQFVERFGGLVTISKNGHVASAVWDVADAYYIYVSPISAMLRVINKANVTGVFLSSEEALGHPVTGRWSHFHAALLPQMLFNSRVQTAGQAMAEKREDFRNVTSALDEYSLPVLKQAIRLLKSDALYRSEKVLGAAEWLRDLHMARKSARIDIRANMTWRAIASAPAGFCHPRSSMIGTLLEDIAAGKGFDDVARSFAAKMHPLQYLRPQAAPTAGAIAQAEKIVAQLDAAGSLARRYARMDDVKALWKPKAASKAAKGGLFSHLKPKGKSRTSDIEIPAITITWEKFARTVVPSAERIEYFVLTKKDSYVTLVTAVNPNSPPILQWDVEGERNPVSCYLWHGGAEAAQFGLTPGLYHDVAAVTLRPSMWGSKQLSHYGEGVMFCLHGAHETKRGGLVIFPENLKSEFHGIRSVMEAYSRAGVLEGADGEHVCGPMLSKGGTWEARIRVTSDGETAVYDLDRWD